MPKEPKAKLLPEELQDLKKFGQGLGRAQNPLVRTQALRLARYSEGELHAEREDLRTLFG